MQVNLHNFLEVAGLFLELQLGFQKVTQRSLLNFDNQRSVGKLRSYPSLSTIPVITQKTYTFLIYKTMLLEQLQKKQSLYDTAFEALTELVENNHESSQTIKDLIMEFKNKRSQANTDFLKQREINEIQVKSVEQVTGN